MTNQKGHSNIGAVLLLVLLITLAGIIVDLSLIVLALLSFFKWHQQGLGIILLISVLVASFSTYLLVRRIGG